jgi:hypothetical protein
MRALLGEVVEAMAAQTTPRQPASRNTVRVRETVEAFVVKLCRDLPSLRKRLRPPIDDSSCVHQRNNQGGKVWGMDPYILMASHGPRQIRWPNSPERATWISGLLGEPCGASGDYLMVKET